MEKLIKALETIKAECAKHPSCKTDCPFILVKSDGLSCDIRYAGAPSNWKIEKPKVITTLLR